jgi:uncharacterized protein YcgI (DUF1989 family)
MAPIRIPPSSGAAVQLIHSQRLKIINTHGSQAVGLWAFSALEKGSVKGGFNFNYLSMCHTRSALLKLRLDIGDRILDNRRLSMLSLVEDTSGGIHDVLFAACDPCRYRQLGVTGYHNSCAEILESELTRFGQSLPEDNAYLRRDTLASAAQMTENWTPDPLNLFMNVPISNEGARLGLNAPVCPPGGYVMFEALTQCVVVISACPMDLNPLYKRTGVEYEVLD